MRVLLTVHQFLPDHFSGTETLTYWTARELRSLGHEVRVLTARLARQAPPDEEALDSYEYDGLRVHRFHLAGTPTLEQPNTVEAEYDNRLAARKLEQVLTEFRPDVVHFFHLARLSASLIDVCRRRGLPTVLTATDFWFICPTTQLRLPDNSPCSGPDPWGVNCLRHFLTWTGRKHLASIVSALPDRVVAAVVAACRTPLLSKAGVTARVRALVDRPRFLRDKLNEVDRVLAPSRLMERMLTNYTLPESKVLYRPFGIESAAPTSSTATAPAAEENSLRVGFIGTLVEHKGAHVFIDAALRLADERIIFKVYGRPGDFPEYAERLRMQASGNPRIHFLGTFASKNIGGIFAGLDVLVVPSVWYENTPLVIYSAQAYGCPVVVTDLEGMAEVVDHEVNGLLFPRGDAEGLAEALRRLARDADLLARLRRNARRPKTIAQYAAECVAVYEEVLGRHLKAPRVDTKPFETGQGQAESA